MNGLSQVQVLGIGGSALLVLAAFLPVATTSLGSTLTLFQNGGWLGIVLFLVSALSFISTVLDKFLLSLVVTAVVAVLCCCRLFLALTPNELRPDWGLGILVLSTVAVSLAVVLVRQRIRTKRLGFAAVSLMLVLIVTWNFNLVGEIKVYETITLRGVLSVMWGSI